ncbi:hypothetical protein D3C72_2413500 [compost metagenome]
MGFLLLSLGQEVRLRVLLDGLEGQTSFIEGFDHSELGAVVPATLGHQQGQHDVLDILTAQGLARHSDFVLQDFGDSDIHEIWISYEVTL